MNSHFRARAYLPFISAVDDPVTVAVDEGNGMGEPGDRGSIQLHTGAYTNQVPDLREEYPDLDVYKRQAAAWRRPGPCLYAVVLRYVCLICRAAIFGIASQMNT